MEICRPNEKVRFTCGSVNGQSAPQFTYRVRLTLAFLLWKYILAESFVSSFFFFFIQKANPQKSKWQDLKLKPLEGYNNSDLHNGYHTSILKPSEARAKKFSRLL